MTLNQAIETAKAKAPHFASKIDAAAEMLRTNPCITETVAGLAITTDNGTYCASENRCQCRASQFGKVCRHRIAVRLLALMATDAEPVATKAATRDELIADIKRANIDGELLRRFRTNDFQLFATETLADIVAAIA